MDVLSVSGSVGGYFIMYGYIYRFTFLPTLEWYVGQHKYKNHTTIDKKYWGSGSKWKSLINQYDKSEWPKLIKREIIEWCETKEELANAEDFWVEFLHARIDGLNIARGGGYFPILYGEDNGFYGKHHSDETKQIIGASTRAWYKAHPEYNPYDAIKVWQEQNPEEFSKQQSINGSKAWSNTPQGHTEEAKDKISKAQIRSFESGNRNYSFVKGDTKDTNETLRKISDSLTGHEVSDISRDKLSKFVSDSTTITNGVYNLRCPVEYVDMYKCLGFVKGQTKHAISYKTPEYKDLFTQVTNGELNHFILKSDLELWLDNGWIEGNCRSLNRRRSKDAQRK